MFAILKAFLSKFDLFKNQIAKGNFMHFRNCKTLAYYNETGLGFDLEKYSHTSHYELPLPLKPRNYEIDF